MSDIEDIKAVIDTWNNGLDNGNIEQMITTCDPQVITLNNRQPMTVGSQAIRDKYVPRIEAADITSRFDIEHIELYGDVAVVVGEFGGEMKDKKTGEIRTPEGRLTLVYQRGTDGAWKMILDIDNNVK